MNRLRKGTDRLLSKGILKSNKKEYLKVTVEENWCSQNFDFLSFKNLLSGQFLGSSNSRRYHYFLKLLVAT